MSTAILKADQDAAPSTGTIGTPTDPNGMVCGLADTGRSMIFQHGPIYVPAHAPAAIVVEPITTETHIARSAVNLVRLAGPYTISAVIGTMDRADRGMCG